MTLDELRIDIAKGQKKGIPFIGASVIIWGLIAIVTRLDIPIGTKNILVFCCSCPLMPLAMLVGRIIKVDIFSKSNPLSNVGFLFTLNQFLYILIVMWVFRAVPEKMVMVYAMVFGAHLLPYSWLYKSPADRIAAIMLPIIALVVGQLAPSTILAIVFMLLEIVFVFVLRTEVKALGKESLSC